MVRIIGLEPFFEPYDSNNNYEERNYFVGVEPDYIFNFLYWKYAKDRIEALFFEVDRVRKEEFREGWWGLMNWDWNKVWIFFCFFFLNLF